MSRRGRDGTRAVEEGKSPASTSISTLALLKEESAGVRERSFAIGVPRCSEYREEPPVWRRSFRPRWRSRLPVADGGARLAMVDQDHLKIQPTRHRDDRASPEKFQERSCACLRDGVGVSEDDESGVRPRSRSPRNRVCRQIILSTGVHSPPSSAPITSLSTISSIRIGR